MNEKYPPYDDRAIPSRDYSGEKQYGTYATNGICQNIAVCNIDISLRRIADSLDNDAKVKTFGEALGKAEAEIQRLQSEVAKWKDNAEHAEGEAAHFKHLYDERIARQFKVGDVVAYVNDSGDGWVCWEVKSIDKSYLYSEENGHGDSIAYAFAYLVKAVEDGR